MLLWQVLGILRVIRPHESMTQLVSASKATPQALTAMTYIGSITFDGCKPMIYDLIYHHE